MDDLLNLSEMDSETREMLTSFVSESLDSLDSCEPLIEEIRESQDNETINAVFRVFHTLKGLSGFFGMNIINKVTHEAETLLDLIRKNPSLINEDVISIIYSAFDFLRELINKVNIDFSDLSAKDEAEDMILIIKDAISRIQNPPSENYFLEENFESDTISETDFFSEDDSPVEATFITNSENNETDEFLSQYLEGALELTETISNNLVILEKDSNNTELIGQTFGAVHSLKGNSGFMGFADIEEIAMDMETILDSVRSHELDLNEIIISILLGNLEMITTRINEYGSGTKTANPIDSQNVELDISNHPIDLNLLDDDSLPKFDEKEQIIENTIPSASDKDIHISSNLPKVESNDSKKTNSAIQKKDIRVDTAKIDRLFDLVGELITIESMVTNNPDIKGMNLPNFSRSANLLNKISRELQEVTMSVRMMPLESLFNKMKRLVRDVSVKMNKKVDLIISGQETEMDKNIIDEIADPLVHLIRNSVDHGIEMPKDRISAGKIETGKVYLTARYEGNEILITIRDDGKGLAKDKILQKAIEKGIISTGNDKLTDKEIFKLIFEPGFSTADKVTDISGRGVGMDVVKKNIEKLRGTIDLDSQPGNGATVILRIPLTLAIIESMVFRIGGSKFAMPILSVIESLKVTNDRITQTMDGLELVKVRNELIPVIRLHELFHKDPDSKNLTDGLLVIVESRERKACLFVDEIIGQQQAVVKSMTDYIGKVPGLTGCMILGDGNIGLIVDIDGIFDLSENTTQTLLKNFEMKEIA